MKYENLIFSGHHTDMIDFIRGDYWHEIQPGTSKRIKVTGTSYVSVKSGYKGAIAREGLYVKFVYPDTWGEQRVLRTIQNHLPVNRINRTLTAARSNVRFKHDAGRLFFIRKKSDH